MTDHPIFWPGGQRASFYKPGNGLSKATKLCVPHARNSKNVYTTENFPWGIWKPPGICYLSSHKRCRVCLSLTSLLEDIRPPTQSENWDEYWRWFQKVFTDFNYLEKYHYSFRKKIQMNIVNNYDKLETYLIILINFNILMKGDKSSVKL